jgi:hypothetical protein
MEDEIGDCDILSLQSLHVPHVRSVHVVLLGDSTLDNGRYLNLASGELSVEKQLAKKCAELGWQMTVLAQDGSLLEDVRTRQLPLIPDQATHLVLSASGNDLLSLLNQMVVANFTLSSVYAAIVEGLKNVAERYRNLLQSLKNLGCHLACCTVYRPNFNHLFFKSLATFSLGLHNSRLKQLAADLDCSVIDLANLFDTSEDFANPLELSTRGGSKLIENVAAFVGDHSIMTMKRYRDFAQAINTSDEAFLPMEDTVGMSMRCCATRATQGRVYARKEVSKALQRADTAFAGGPLGRPLAFSEAQQRWRQS